MVLPPVICPPFEPIVPESTGGGSGPDGLDGSGDPDTPLTEWIDPWPTGGLDPVIDGGTVESTLDTSTVIGEEIDGINRGCWFPPALPVPEATEVVRATTMAIGEESGEAFDPADFWLEPKPAADGSDTWSSDGTDSSVPEGFEDVFWTEPADTEIGWIPEESIRPFGFEVPFSDSDLDATDAGSSLDGGADTIAEFDLGSSSPEQADGSEFSKNVSFSDPVTFSCWIDQALPPLLLSTAVPLPSDPSDEAVAGSSDQAFGEDTSTPSGSIDGVATDNSSEISLEADPPSEPMLFTTMAVGEEAGDVAYIPSLPLDASIVEDPFIPALPPELGHDGNADDFSTWTDVVPVESGMPVKLDLDVSDGFADDSSLATDSAQTDFTDSSDDGLFVDTYEYGTYSYVYNPDYSECDYFTDSADYSDYSDYIYNTVPEPWGYVSIDGSYDYYDSDQEITYYDCFDATTDSEEYNQTVYASGATTYQSLPIFATCHGEVDPAEPTDSLSYLVDPPLYDGIEVDSSISIVADPDSNVLGDDANSTESNLEEVSETHLVELFDSNVLPTWTTKAYGEDASGGFDPYQTIVEDDFINDPIFTLGEVLISEHYNVLFETLVGMADNQETIDSPENSEINIAPRPLLGRGQDSDGVIKPWYRSAVFKAAESESSDSSESASTSLQETLDGEFTSVVFDSEPKAMLAEFTPDTEPDPRILSTLSTLKSEVLAASSIDVSTPAPAIDPLSAASGILSPSNPVSAPLTSPAESAPLQSVANQEIPQSAAITNVSDGPPSVALTPVGSPPAVTAPAETNQLTTTFDQDGVNPISLLFQDPGRKAPNPLENFELPLLSSKS
jgi:hypothetical protein